MSDILEKIKGYKLEDVAKRKSIRPLSRLEKDASEASPVRGFRNALSDKVTETGLALIAEVKKASPSKGLIRPDFNPVQLAKAYEKGGAACLSVLTDEPSFQGADAFLIEARAATNLPALRKDFLFDTYQVVEARAMGADCILIIMAALEDSQAQDLEAAAMQWEMDVLIETHDEAEVERALKNLKSPLIGVNNRNLRTFETSLDNTHRLTPLIGSDKEIVCESGLSQYADLQSVAAIGVRRFLIGESLMRQADVEQATKTILGKS